MSETITCYGKTFNHLFRVCTYWYRTDFPNLVLLVANGQAPYPPEFECLLKTENEAPQWIKNFRKSETPEFPLTQFFDFIDYEPENFEWEEQDVTGSSHQSKAEIPPEVLEVGQYAPSITHECDGEKYLYYVWRTSGVGFSLGLLDGVKYSTEEEFWDAAKQASLFNYTDEVFDFDLWNDNREGFEIQNCSHCTIDLDVEDFESAGCNPNYLEAVNETLAAVNLTHEQISKIDDILMLTFSKRDEEVFDEEDLPDLENLVKQLIAKYPGSFEKLEYWLATN